MQRICRHCSKNVASRARGLCWGCYHTPAIKALYPSKTAHWETGSLRIGNKTPPICPRATAARPGSREKKRVMIRRAKLGYAIFHPADARF